MHGPIAAPYCLPAWAISVWCVGRGEPIPGTEPNTKGCLATHTSRTIHPPHTILPNTSPHCCQTRSLGSAHKLHNCWLACTRYCNHTDNQHTILQTVKQSHTAFGALQSIERATPHAHTHTYGSAWHRGKPHAHCTRIDLQRKRVAVSVLRQYIGLDG